MKSLKESCGSNLDPIGVAIKLQAMHEIMEETQLRKSIEVENNIALLATYKLSMIKKNDLAGYKRICKQQAQVAKIGMELVGQLTSNSQQSDEQ